MNLDVNALATFSVVAMMPAVVVKLTSEIKYISAAAWREAWTQLIPWIAGTAVVALAAQSDLGGGIVVAGRALSTLNFATVVLLGFAYGSGGSVVRDVIKAFDNTDSASEPALGVKQAA
jgi:hypothetical protein